MKKLILILAVVFLTGCQRGCAKMERSFQTGTRNYNVKQFSGGKLIGEYNFKGILNNQEHSDGYYFYEGDSLIEVSGDITVKSW